MPDATGEKGHRIEELESQLAGLRTRLEKLGGEVETGRRVTSLAQLPASKVVLFDTSPEQLASIAGDALPDGALRL